MIRQIINNQAYHVYNRSVLKMPLFRDPRDYLRFITKMSELKKEMTIELSAYCLMSTHFHLILREPALKKPTNMAQLSKFMQRLQNSYAKYFTIKYKHSGRVFQGAYKNKQIENEEHFCIIRDYIHQNPVRKKMVRSTSKWPYSSASNPNL